MANLSDAQADILSDVSTHFFHTSEQPPRRFRARLSLLRSESCTATARPLNATMRPSCWHSPRRPSTRRTRRWRGAWSAMSRLSRGTKRRYCKGEGASSSYNLRVFTRVYCVLTPHWYWQCISTLENAYAKIIASLVNSQQEHLNLADALSVQVVAVLLSLARKNEGHRKKASRASFLLLRRYDILHNEPPLLASSIPPEGHGR